MTIPSVGPIIATAMLALAPPAQTLPHAAATSPPGWASRRDSDRPAARRGSAASPRRASERSRRLLIIGASAVVRHASKRGAPEGSWLAKMLARKPRMLVTVALANKTARIIWALLAKGGVYKAPAVAA